MRTQTTQSFDLQGLRGNGVAVAHDVRATQPTPNSRRAELSNDDHADFDRFDDGLVHGHFWAMSSTVR